MFEAPQTVILQEAIEKAHKERAQAFKALFESWFGLRGFFHFGGQTRTA